jgi:hypothetical protein
MCLVLPNYYSTEHEIDQETTDDLLKKHEARPRHGFHKPVCDEQLRPRYSLTLQTIIIEELLKRTLRSYKNVRASYSSVIKY